MHVNNPNLALDKAWERLRESYAAPEVIERSMFQRLDNFPKISAKDHLKLRELGDLLTEIQGAKEDGYLAGLSYLDTSRGIGPIVDKLPYGLQEKWVSAGSRYKEGNNRRFPPFEYFCNFISYEAKKRNDPSFNYQGSTTTPTKPDKPFSRNLNTNEPISVHTTDISTINNEPISVHTTDISTTNNDPNNNCPLHNKPHPLKRCKTFRNKLLDDRKAFLKEKGMFQVLCLQLPPCQRLQVPCDVL